MDNPLLEILYVLLLTSIFFIILHLWKKRSYYYYGLKLPGPLALPFIGNAYLLPFLLNKPEKLLRKVNTFCQRYPAIFRLWAGPQLFVVVSDPEVIQTILSRFSDKGKISYDTTKDAFPSFLVERGKEWAMRRKIASSNFRSTFLHQNVQVFQKHSKALVEKLEGNLGVEVDIYELLLDCALNTAFEMLAGVDPDLIDLKDKYKERSLRIDDWLCQRYHSFFMNLFWRFSSVRRNMKDFNRQNENYIIEIAKSKLNKNKKSLLNDFFLAADKKGLTLRDVAADTSSLLIIATGTSTVVISSVLLLLGMNPQIQEKLFQELENNKMEYLKYVIKESMRILTPVSLIIRELDEDLTLDKGMTIPNGTTVLIPIPYVHTRSDLWSNPFKFDPDRFLPENVEQRHRCAFVPFGSGPRICLGYKYAMLSMKVTLTAILKKYKVVWTEYKTVEEMDFLVGISTVAEKGYKIKLERR